MTREKAIDIFKCLAWHDIRPDVEDVEQAIKTLDQDTALDKIRAEVEGMTPTYHNLNWSITDLVPISEVLKFIDKYKTESEE